TAAHLSEHGPGLGAGPAALHRGAGTARRGRRGRLPVPPLTRPPAPRVRVLPGPRRRTARATRAPGPPARRGEVAARRRPISHAGPATAHGGAAMTGTRQGWPLLVLAAAITWPAGAGAGEQHWFPGCPRASYSPVHYWAPELQRLYWHCRGPGLSVYPSPP